MSYEFRHAELVSASQCFYLMLKQVQHDECYEL